MNIRRTMLFAAFLVWMAGSRSLLAQGCDCLLGLKTGTTVTNIDGVVDAEWKDASVIDTSVDPSCLKSLLDWNHATPTPITSLVDKNLKVYSKRDANNLYLAITVPDETKNRQDAGHAGEPLVLGERVILQFDPNASRGTQLGNGGSAIQKDYRLEVTHNWNTGANGVINVNPPQFFDSTLPGANSPCGVQDWNAQTTPAGVAVAAHDDGTGYTIELRIPLSAIGSPASDIGIAFAVINDLGSCPGGVCDSTGSGFPGALPLNNVSGPLLSNDPAGCGAWRTPNNWGTGYFTNAMPSVEISRLPVAWDSMDIQAFPCAGEVSDYLYYPQKACKLRITSKIRNSGPTNQTRNLLYLWADHGSAPAVWRVIQLKENVTIAPGGTSVTTDLWNNVPSGLANHPCVRVYILPTSFVPAFDKAHILAIASAADVTSLETAYSIGTKCWAQKNLSRQADGTSCPIQGCSSLSLMHPLRMPGFFESLNTSSVFAQAPPGAAPNGVIFWNAAEQGRFAADHVAAQFREFGVGPLRAAPRPIYNIIEDMGGAIQLYQTVLLKKNGRTPIQLVVGNPDNFQRTVWLRVDTAIPPGFGEFHVDINQGPLVVNAGQQNTVKGTAIPGAITSGKSCFGKSTSGSGMLLVAGVFLLGLRAYKKA